MLNLPVILILMYGIYAILRKVSPTRKPIVKPRFPSAIEHLLSLDSDQKTN